MDKLFSNIEIVTLAAYLLGGASSYIDTEDVAMKVNQLAPGRFTWLKYRDQINIEKVRTSLSDAKKVKNGTYILGTHIKGWLLSENGLEFSKHRVEDLEGADISREPMSKSERLWKNREKKRMLSSYTYEVLKINGIDLVTPQEAEAFFSINDYVVGKARERKLIRILNTFGDDTDLGWAIKALAGKVRKK